MHGCKTSMRGPVTVRPQALIPLRKGAGAAYISGAVMRETKGRADGGEVQRLIRERIG